jgi:hypothetical protein
MRVGTFTAVLRKEDPLYVAEVPRSWHGQPVAPRTGSRDAARILKKAGVAQMNSLPRSSYFSALTCCCQFLPIARQASFTEFPSSNDSPEAITLPFLSESAQRLPLPPPCCRSRK